jgi:bifunctional DNase/RNase
MPRSARSVHALALLPVLLAPLACSTTSPPRADEVAVRVRGVGMDARTQSPVVLLDETGGERSLPIWIGFPEARSIADQIEGVVPPRPNTHDLATRLIRGLDGQVERVIVTELRENTYYALIVLRLDGTRLEIDARPSDAIAIALRFEAPVYVREALFDGAEEERDPEQTEPEPAPGEPI